MRKRLAAGKDFITCQECDKRVPLIDFIEQRLKSDPVARKILAMEETATKALDTQALEQILIGHMMAICGEANQIFRPVAMFDRGIDGEVEFKDNDGKASGKKIYVQLRSWDYYRRDGRDVYEVKDGLWSGLGADVYLVVRQAGERTGEEGIRWMNVKGRRIVFEGERLDMQAVWKVRDGFFPPGRGKKA